MDEIARTSKALTFLVGVNVGIARVGPTNTRSNMSWMRRITQKYPVTLNSLIGSFLFTVSDTLAQKLEQERVPVDHDDVEGNREMTAHLSACPASPFALDVHRSLNAGILGIIFGGIVYPTAYRVLDRIWSGTNLGTVIQKSLVEIATVGIFVNSTSIASRGLLAGHPVLDVKNHVAAEILPVTLNDINVWLPYNILAFSLVPIHIRPACTSLMEAGWQTYISWRSHDYSSVR